MKSWCQISHIFHALLQKSVRLECLVYSAKYIALVMFKLDYSKIIGRKGFCFYGLWICDGRQVVSKYIQNASNIRSRYSTQQHHHKLLLLLWYSCITFTRKLTLIRLEIVLRGCCDGSIGSSRHTIQILQHTWNWQ